MRMDLADNRREKISCGFAIKKHTQRVGRRMQ